MADWMVNACSSMRMRKLSREGKGGTPDQAAAGIGEGDVEKSYMKLPKAHTGRPPVHDLLASLCGQHAAEASITVIAAGTVLELSNDCRSFARPCAGMLPVIKHSEWSIHACSRMARVPPMNSVML